MIVGLTGSFGAGKGAVVSHLVEQEGFTHYSASGFIVEEIERRGLPVNRDSMIFVGNDLRKEYGPGYIIDSLIVRAKKAGGDAVVESLRAVAEVDAVHTAGGFVIGVDADPKLRYERSVMRGGKKDNVSFEKWEEQERVENDQNDPTKQNIFGALTKSDVVLMNEGSLEELHQKVDEALKMFSQQQRD